MPQLDNYLVALGMKGQNVVLSTMDKIRKKGGDLSKKKTVVTLATKTAPKTEQPAGITEKLKPGEKQKQLPGEKQKRLISEKQRELPGEKQRELSGGEQKQLPGEKQKTTLPDESTKKFSKAIDNFHSGVKDFTSSAATLDPVATVSSVTSALGTALSGISVATLSLGRLPEGIAHIANSMLSMAKNTIDMAKQATATFHQLTIRNVTAEHYGKMITTDKNKSPLSKNERAMFIDMVSGSMGRIQQPLADEINKLIGKKDTRALARVSAGDWESTGTDKGWILGQISNGFSGLMPSIRQKLQAELLKNYSGEIQDMTAGQRNVQRNAGIFADIEEGQTERLYNKSAGNANITVAIKQMNDLQAVLFTTGLKFTDTINKTATVLNELPATIEKMHSALKNFVADPGISNARNLIKSVKVGK